MGKHLRALFFEPITRITTHEELAAYQAELEAKVRPTPESIAATRIECAPFTISADGLTAKVRIRTTWNPELKLSVLIDAADLERVNNRRWSGIRRNGRIKVFTFGDGLRCMGLGRFVLEITDRGRQVRYRNGDPLDNRRSNLQARPLAAQR